MFNLTESPAPSDASAASGGAHTRSSAASSSIPLPEPLSSLAAACRPHAYSTASRHAAAAASPDRAQRRLTTLTARKNIVRVDRALKAMQVAFQLKREATASPTRESSVEDTAHQRRARRKGKITVDECAEGSRRESITEDGIAGQGSVGGCSRGERTAAGLSVVGDGCTRERDASRRVKRWRVMAASFRTIADELTAEAEELEKAIQEAGPCKI
jgi:hypothetical protein